jgi:hypothetical protein
VEPAGAKRGRFIIEHVYKDKLEHDVTVTVTDNGGLSAQATRVLNSPLVNTTPVTTISLRGGVSSGQVVVATFTDRNPSAVPSDHSAVILWGDGTSSVGTVERVSRSARGSMWRVVGSHTYANPTSVAYYAATVTVTDGGSSFTTSNTRFSVRRYPGGSHSPNFGGGSAG